MAFRILAIACISIMAAMLGLGILTPILPLYARNLGASGTMLGLIYASFAVTMALCNPLVGRLSDRYGYKLFIALGLGLSVPVALLYVVATTPYHLIMIRLLEGVFCAMIQNATIACVGSAAPTDREGSFMGIYNAFFLLGFGLGPLMGGTLTDTYNMRVPFYVMAACLALACICVVIFLPDGRPRHKDKPADKRPPAGTILRDRLMQGMLVFGFILALGQSGLMAFLPLLTWRESLSATQIGLLSSTILVCGGLLQAPFGYLANRYDKLKLVISGVLLFGVGLAYIPLCHSFFWFFLFSLLGGLAIAICNPAANAIMVKGLKSYGLGYAFGMYNLSMGLGMIIGPVFAGLVVDFSGLDHMFYISAALYIVAAIAIYYTTRHIRGL